MNVSVAVVVTVASAKIDPLHFPSSLSLFLLQTLVLYACLLLLVFVVVVRYFLFFFFFLQKDIPLDDDGSIS